MKEDYLWDKSGTDPEIEGLENALKAFRYKGADLLPLPLKIKEVAPEQPRRNWFFAMAFAGAAACIVLVLSVIALRQFTNPKSNETVSSTPQPVDKVTTPDDPVRVADNNPTKPEQKKRLKPAPQKQEAFRPQYLVLRTPEIEDEKPVKKPRKAKAQTVALKQEFTQEEKDAYNKLMFALSVTSKQMKTVKDKINGVKDSQSVSNPVSPLKKEELR